EPFRLLQVVDDRLELCLGEAMTASISVEEGRPIDETVTVRWGEVEIAILPARPSSIVRVAPRRSWPLELLSSTAATVIGMTSVFPALVLLVALGRGEPERERTLPALIVFS